MNKWITYIVEGQSVDSVSKARYDVAKIAKDIGFKILYVYRYIDNFEDEKSLIARIDGITAGVAPGDLVVYQYPSYNKFEFDKMFIYRLKQRKVKLAILIHDSEFLRNHNFIGELELYNQVDILITHGEKMEAKLKSSGVHSHMIRKKLFDYLIEDEQIALDSELKKSLVVAGNLQKSIFLNKWMNNTKVYAFGEIKNVDLGKNVTYVGAYSQNNLIKAIPKNNFGIAWDDDLYQGGNYQEYTRYNSPHKVSLYLALGLPVIVWEESSIADFITKYRLGYTIKSISDVDILMAKITTEEMLLLKQRVNKFSNLLKEGIFTKLALITVEQWILFEELDG